MRKTTVAAIQMGCGSDVKENIEKASELIRKEWLPTLPGMPPTLIHPPKGDAFAERNAYAMRIDYEKEPPMFQVTDTHYAATWLLDERAPKVKAPIGERRYGK